jgi:hypothetical protein
MPDFPTSTAVLNATSGVSSGTIQNTMTSGDIVQGTFLLFLLMIVLWIAISLSVRRTKIDFQNK